MLHEGSFEARMRYDITGDSAHVLDFAHQVPLLPANVRNLLQTKEIVYAGELMG